VKGFFNSTAQLLTSKMSIWLKFVVGVLVVAPKRLLLGWARFDQILITTGVVYDWRRVQEPAEVAVQSSQRWDQSSSAHESVHDSEWFQLYSADVLVQVDHQELNHRGNYICTYLGLTKLCLPQVRFDLKVTQPLGPDSSDLLCE
jgi:hypothetical protein